MRIPKTLLAGAAVVALAAVPALAADSGAPSQAPIHHVSIKLPGGGVAEISYTGNVAPKVVIGPAASDAMFTAPAAFMPAPAWFANDPAFAEMQRISADMNRQMDTLFHEVQSTMALAPMGGAPALSEATLHNLPAGAQSYSWFASTNGNNFCSRSVEITSSPNGGKPKVVSHTSGNCGGANANAATTGGTNTGLTQIDAKMPASHPARTSL